VIGCDGSLAKTPRPCGKKVCTPCKAGSKRANLEKTLEKFDTGEECGYYRRQSRAEASTTKWRREEVADRGEGAESTEPAHQPHTQRRQYIATSIVVKVCCCSL
jgi:hypothetical protein